MSMPIYLEGSDISIFSCDCYKFSLSNRASSSYIVLLIADALRHPQLVLVIFDSFLTRLLTYLFSAC
jgi:hypothetical protein